MWGCRRWRDTSSVGDMIGELELLFLETCMEQPALAFFYTILSGTVSLDKDKYLTPAPNLRKLGHIMNYSTLGILLIVML